MLFLLVSVILIASFLFFVEGGTFLPAPAEYIDDLRLRYHNSTSSTGRTGEDAVLEALAASRYNKFYVQDCYCTSTPSFILGNRTCPDIPSRFDSILQAMWFGVVTITTAGYGDFVPVCAGGKLIASFGLLLSTIFLAMPIAIVGESFTETVAAMNERDEAKKKATATNIAVLRMDAEIADLGAVDDGAKIGQGARSKARTAGEGLIQYLGATLRARFLSPQDPPMVDGFAEEQDYRDGPPAPSDDSAHDVSKANSRDAEQTRRRLQLSHHINAYVSTLMESWVASWISEHVTARGQDKSLTGTKLAMLKELASVEVRSFPSTSKLRNSEISPVVAQEMILDRAAEYVIIAEPPGASSSSVTAEGAPALMNVYCKEMRLPQVVARVVQLRGFLSRRTVVLPGTPTHQIAVNGQLVPCTGVQVNPGDTLNLTPQMRVTDGAFGSVTAVGHTQTDTDCDILTLDPAAREARLSRLSAVGIHPITLVLSESDASGLASAQLPQLRHGGRSDQDTSVKFL
jgi:hypothetical protein